MHRGGGTKGGDGGSGKDGGQEDVDGIGVGVDALEADAELDGADMILGQSAGRRCVRRLKLAQ